MNVDLSVRLLVSKEEIGCLRGARDVIRMGIGKKGVHVCLTCFDKMKKRILDQ